MKNNKRWLSLLLVFVMMLSVMPLNVFAAAVNTEAPTTGSDTTVNNDATVEKPAKTEETKKKDPVTDVKKEKEEIVPLAAPTLNVNGCEAVPANPAAGEGVTVKAIIPDGKVFKDWTVTGEVSTSSKDVNPLCFTMPATGSVTVTANFKDPEPTKYNISIPDGTANPNPAAGGAKVTISATIPTGKAFEKWETTTTDVYFDDETKVTTFFTMPSKDVTITAKFSDVTNKHTVKFNSNGGTTVPNQYLDDGAVIKQPSNPTKKGYTFEGWYKDSKLEYKWDFATPVTANMTLYAKWTSDKTLSSVSISPSSATVNQGKSKDFTASVSGTNITNSDVSYKWELSNENKDTSLSNKTTRYTTLKVASNETASYVNVKVTATYNGVSKTDTVKVKINDDYDTLKITSAYRSGNYIKGKVNVGGATVRYYRNDSSSSYASDTADSSGYYEIYIGNISVSRNDYVRATKTGYSQSSKVYLSSSSGGWNDDKNKEVYPKSVDLYDDGYRVKGRLSDYKNTKIYVEYDGREIGSGYTDSNGYFDIKLDRRVSRESDLRYFTGSSTTQSSKTKVHPSDIYLYNDNRRVEGKLTSYKNTKVYVYYDNDLIGSGYTNSDGKFDINLDRRVSSKSDLTFYVDSSTNKTKAASITSAKAGEYKIEGTAAAYATVTVKDKDNVKLGSATADKDGKFTIYANRTLKSGEKLTITTSESGKSDNTTTYTVSESKTADLKRIAYIKGYPNGNFKPHGNITRGEAATMFARLLNNSDNFGTTKTTKFTDANNQWYSEAINYVVNKGLISGYPDGTFKPNANITRAEFAQMISGYVTVGGNATNFKDVNDHWAKEAIEKLYGNKSVTGYPDGTFKPNDEITRAEAVTILNSVFGRVSNTQSFDSVKSSLKSFGDVKSSDWFYANVMDASNAHDSYRKSSTDDTEVWTKIN